MLTTRRRHLPPPPPVLSRMCDAIYATQQQPVDQCRQSVPCSGAGAQLERAPHPLRGPLILPSRASGRDVVVVVRHSSSGLSRLLALRPSGVGATCVVVRALLHAKTVRWSALHTHGSRRPPQVLANCDSRVARLRVTRAPGAVVRTVEPALLLWRGPASGRGSMQTAEKPWPGGPRKLEQRWPNVEEQRRG